MSPLRNIRRFVLPSRTLAKYVARMFLLRFIIFLLGLVVVLQVLDLMGKSDNILAGDGADYGSLVQYLRLRLPQLIAQFAPFAALLGVVSTLATLNQSSEITIMKSVGLSAFHIIAPTLAIGLLIAIAHFTFNETVVVDANKRLEYWEANDYSNTIPEEPSSVDQNWMVDGGTIIEVGGIEQNGRVLLLNDVTLYERDSNAKLTSIASALSAAYTNGSWTLIDVDRFALPTFEATHSDSEPWALSIPAERFVAMAVEADETPIFELASSIRELEEQGHPTALLKGPLYHKVSGPLASVLMPLLAAVAGFGLARGGALFVRIIAGMALGFAYFVADNFTLALGNFGALPPMLAAWSPFVLFLLLGLTVLFYMEE